MQRLYKFDMKEILLGNWNPASLKIQSPLVSETSNGILQMCLLCVVHPNSPPLISGLAHCLAACDGSYVHVLLTAYKLHDAAGVKLGNTTQQQTIRGPFDS